MRHSRVRRRRIGPGVLLTIAAGCTGVVQSPGGGSHGGATEQEPAALACAMSGGKLNAGVSPLRRLTRDQYNNTVRDLIGATGTPADMLAEDEKIGPFHSNAIAPITDLEVQQHKEVAAS